MGLTGGGSHLENGICFVFLVFFARKKKTGKYCKDREDKWSWPPWCSLLAESRSCGRGQNNFLHERELSKTWAMYGFWCVLISCHNYFMTLLSCKQEKTKVLWNITKESDNIWCQASRCGRVDSTFTCWSSSTRSNLTAAKSWRPLLPALCCLYEGCPEGGSAVYTSIQCTPLLVEKAGVAPDVTLRFTANP